MTGILFHVGTCRPSSVNPKKHHQVELLEPCFIGKVCWLASAAVSDSPAPPKSSRIPRVCSTGLELDLKEGLPPSCIPSSSAASHGPPSPTMVLNGVASGNGQDPVVGWGSGEVLTALHPFERPRVSLFLALTGCISGFALSHLLV